MSFTPKIWNDNDILSILDLNRLEEAVAEMGNYTPTVWAAGDKITAEKMNKLEQGVAGEFWNTVFEGNVTTEVEGGAPFAEGNIEGLTNLSADSIKVTFNGTEYECNKIVQGVNNIYGGVGEDGPEFSQYPFAIMSSEGNGTLFFTQTAGTYSLKIEESQSDGESDYSTVEVSITNNTNIASLDIALPNAVESNPMVFPPTTDKMSARVSIASGATANFNIMLYKGTAEGYIMLQNYNYEATGGVTISGRTITISGNGTIAIWPTIS